MKNLHNLDLLRSMAVTFVLVDHTSWALGHHAFGRFDTGNLGVFGVYLFFVHTALVLMGSLERQPQTLSFYVRRIFRIYPLAMAATAAGLLVPVWAGGAGWNRIHFTGSTILSNLLLIQDLAHRPNIVGVMWTLTMEVQMYVLLPALFFLAVREKKVWTLVVLWAFAVVVGHSYFPGPAVFFLKVIANFIPGVIAYLIFDRRSPAPLPAWSFAPFLFVLLAVYMLVPSPEVSWCISLALGFALPQFRQISMPWLVEASQQVALYSYGVYLWHSFGIKLGFRFFHNPWAQVVAELVFTAFMSIAGYRVLEEPLIRYGNRLGHRLAVSKGTLVATTTASTPRTYRHV